MATKLKDKLKKATQSATRAANETARKTAQKTGVKEKQNNSTPIRNVQSKTKAKVDKAKTAAKEQNRTPKNKGTSKPVKRVQNIAEQSKYGQKAKADQKKAQQALDKDRYVRDQTARAAVTQDNIAKGRNLPKKSSGVLKEYGMEKYKSGLSPSNLDQTVKAYDLKSKNYGLGKDKVSATDIINAGTLDPLSQLKADSMSKANFGRWANPPPSKKKTDKELVQDATKKLKQATHKKGAKQQKTSIYDQSLGKQWENEIKLNKQSWDAADALYNAALRRGDEKAAEKYAKQRDEAHEQAETWRRIKGGFSGGASGDEYIRPKLDMKDKNLLNKEGEKRLAAAKLGYENAKTDAEKAMYAAMGQSIRNNPKYNLKKGREQRGETYDPGAYREFDANGRMRYAGTEEERKKEQEQTLAIPKTIGYTVAGAFASLPGTTARALREDAYNNQGYLQNLSDIRGGGEVKISEPEKKKTPQERLQELYRDDYFINASPVLKAKKLARVIKAIHDDIPVGQRLLAKGEQYHKLATEGQSGLERYLTEAIIMAGEMAPGLLATGLSGGAAAPGLITMGAQAAGQTMGSLESQGVNPVEAFERGALSGFIEAGTELIPLKHLLKMGKGEGKSFAKELITQLIEEVGTEEASEILGFAVDEYYEKPDLIAETLWNDIQNSLLPSMKDTAAITALTTLGMGTGAGTIGSMRKRVDAQDLTTPTAEDLAKQREALEAEKAQWEMVNARLLDRLQNNTDDPRVHKFFLQELQEHEAKKKELEAKEAGLTMQEMARNEIEAQKQELEQAEQGQTESKPEAIEQPKRELPATQDQAQPVQQEPQPQRQTGSNPLLDAIGKRFGAEGQQTQTQQQEQPQTNPAEALRQSAQPQTQEQEQTETGKYKPGLDWNDAQVKTFSAKVANELDTIAKKLGVHIRFANLNEDVDTSDPEAVYNEGYIEDGVITISRDIERPVEYVLGHEITHRMKELAPEEYQILEDYVKGLGKYQGMVQAKIDEYQRGGETLDEEEAWEEITADFAGDIIGSEELMSDFIRGVSHEPTLLQKIKEFFQDLAAKLTGNRKVQVQKAIRMIDNALGKSAEVIENGEEYKHTKGPKYSIESVDGKLMTVINTEHNTSKLDSTKAYLEALVNEEKPFSTLLSDTTPVYIGKDLPGEYMYADNSVGLGTNGKAIKNQAVTNLDEMVLLAERGDWKRNIKRKHNKDAKNGWYRYPTEFAVPVKNLAGEVTHMNVYEGELLLRNDADGKTYLYDLLLDEQKKRVVSPVSPSAIPQGPSSPKPEHMPVGNQQRDISGPMLSEDTINDEEQNINRQTAEKVGVEIHEENGSASRRHYSRRTHEQSDYVQDRKNAVKALAKSLKITQKKAAKYIDDVNTIAAKIAEDRMRLDYEQNPFLGKPGEKGKDSSLVGNTEYGGSIDFSTICKKRRLYTGTLDAIQKALPNKALTVDEMLMIRNMMKERGYEVACGLCYVEGSRAKLGQYAQTFINILKDEGASRIPSLAEINTTDGLQKIRREEPELYERYNSYLKSLNQRTPKSMMPDTEYNGEILAFGGKVNKTTGRLYVDEYNENGGFRLQSFSDFEVIHLIDAMQVIMDMSRVGLKGQAYTKVADFARALGGTGLKINLSMIAKGLDENGRLIFDEVEGMKEKEALELRDKYADSVGTVVVVFTADQLRAALADERIDFVLPFHHSQWKEELYPAMGLPKGTKSFQRFQNDYPNDAVKKEDKVNLKPMTFWDFKKTGRQNAETYLRLCHEQNRTPKFAKLHGKDYLLIKNEDGSYSLPDGPIGDNYWKLLIDVKMYNHLTGKGLPQKVVKPEFDMEEADRMLDDYTGGHDKFPVAQDVVDEFIGMEQTKSFLRNGGQLGAGGTVSSKPRFSKRKRDADYKKAVDEGDMATARRIVDEAAMESGYTIKGFHGTDAEFNEFKLGDIGYHIGTRAQANDRIKQAGLRSTQAGRNPHVLNLYAKIENPLVIDRDFGDWHGKNVAEMLLETEQWEEGYDENAEEINARLREIAAMPDGTFTDTTLRNYLKSLGYDGIEYQNQFEDIDEDAPVDSYDTSYIAFDSSQLKRFDPVIRDDNGEIIPPSERFNHKKKDIRFSKRMIQDYREAAKNKDAQTASKIVREAAAQAGYTVPVYHGTQQFGFTVPEGSKGDDGISFFVTGDIDTARTYSDSEGVRQISDKRSSPESRRQLANDARFEAADGIVKLSRKLDEMSKDLFNPTTMLIMMSEDIENVSDRDEAEGVVEDYFDSLLEHLYNRLEGNEDNAPDDLEFDWLLDEGNEITNQFRKEFEDARQLSYSLAQTTWSGEGYGNYNLFLDPTGLLEVNGGGKQWWGIPFEPVGIASTREIAKWAKDHDYTGVHFKGIVDDGGKGIERSGPADVYAIFSPEYQTKSADPFTYDDKGDLIPLEERFDPNNPDWRWSKRKLGDNSMHESIYGKKKLPRRKKKRPERTESDRQGPYSVGAAPSGFDPYSHMQNEYGTIDPGENPSRIVDVPKSTNGKDRVRRWTRTAMEAQITPDEAVEAFEQEVVKGTFSYDPRKDKASVQAATQTLEDKGYWGAMDQWEDCVQGRREASKDDIVLAQFLYAEAARAKDIPTMRKLAAEIAAEGTVSGQKIQALRLLKKATPEGKLYYIHRIVGKIQNELDVSRGDKAPTLTINPALEGKLLDAETEEEQNEALDDIYDDVAKQIPGTIADRLNAWRYFAMLGNPRTHIRNIVGNVVVQAPLQVSNKASALLQAALPQEKRTRAVASSRSATQFAKQDFEEMRTVLANGGKYMTEKGEIERRRKLFPTPIQKLMDANSAALEAEDMFFKKATYIQSLASFITARGWNPSTMTETQLEQARTHAIKDALHATFQNESAFAKALARIENRNVGTKIAVGGLVPFKSVPINIAKMGFDLSPAGLVKAITSDAYKVKHGTMDATDMIDHLTRGLTGTSVALLGYFLASQGLLSAGGDDDKEEQFELAQGSQNYALNLGDHSYTIDWAAPSAIPLFLGAEYYNHRERRGENADDETKYKDGLESLSRIFDPMLNMTVLSGVSGTLQSVAYSKTNPLFPLASSMAQNYAGQFVPTLLGQIARTADDTRRTTFVDRDSPIPNSIQRFLQKQENKIPGLSQNNIPYLDVWGREDVETNPLLRAFENFISPGYISKRTTDAVDEELSRLNSLGFEDVLPSKAKASTKIEDRYLSKDEYETLVKTQGGTARDILEDVIGNPEYNQMTDEEKAKYVAKIFDFSKQYGKLEIGVPEDKVDSYARNAKEGKETLGLDPAKFLSSYVKKLAMDKDESEDKTAKAFDFELSVDARDDLTDEQKEFIKDRIKFWNNFSVKTDSYRKALNKGLTPDEVKKAFSIKKAADTDESGGVSNDELIVAISNSGESPEMQAKYWSALADSAKTWEEAVAGKQEAEKKIEEKKNAYQKYFGSYDTEQVDSAIKYIEDNGGWYTGLTQFTANLKAAGVPREQYENFYNYANVKRGSRAWKSPVEKVAKKYGW